MQYLQGWKLRLGSSGTLSSRPTRSEFLIGTCDAKLFAGSYCTTLTAEQRETQCCERRKWSESEDRERERERERERGEREGDGRGNETRKESLRKH